MSQFDFYKSFQFIAELIVAESLFLYTFKKKNHFLIKAVIGLIVTFLFSYLFPTLSKHPAYMSFTFICLFCFTVIVMKFLFDESWLKIFYFSIAGYTVQHLAYQLYNTTLTIMTGKAEQLPNLYGESIAPTFTNPFLTIIYAFIYVFTYFFAWYFFTQRISGKEFEMPSFFGFALVLVLLAVNVILNSIVVNAFDEAPVIILCGVYNTVCCVFGLLIQFNVLLRYEYFHKLQLNNVISRLEKERYAAIKDAMEAVNLKAHDLKYQVKKLRDKKLLSQSAVNGIESAVSEYSAYAFTGNDPLDVVLTEINRVCKKNDIRASYVANGKLISFMDEEDVYSLFFNLLDNAIDALKKYPPEKRTMGLKIKNPTGNLVSVTVYNYCEDANLIFDGDLPKTTKKNKEVHGFGLKSVKKICDKYKAPLDITVEKNFFNVNILFSAALQSAEDKNK